MSGSALWGGVLAVAAAVAIVLQVRSWRAGRMSTLQLAAGLIARVGFLFLGVMYAARLTEGWQRAPFIGLGIVGVGIVLNLTAGVIENIRRARHAPGEGAE